MADRVDFYFRQRVTEAELDLAFALLEKADQNFAADLGIFGIISGAVPLPHSPVPDLSIDLTPSTRAYDRLGQRIFVGTGQTVDCSVDLAGVPTEVLTAGEERWLGVFLRFRRQLSDPRTDGNSQQVFFRRDESFELVVRQGLAAPSGLAPKLALQDDELLVCDVRRRHGQTQIRESDIDLSRRQAFVFARSSAVSVEPGGWTALEPRTPTVQSALDSIDENLAEHLRGRSRRHTAADIDFAPHGFVGATTVQTAFGELLDRLSATAQGSAGASRVGADAVPGAPHALSASNVDTQLSQLLGFVNTHVGATTGAHAASTVSALPHAYVAATNVQAQLQEIVADLALSTAGAAGASRIGADAAAGSPNALATGTVKDQLAALLGFLNAHLTASTGAAHPAASIALADAGNQFDAESVEGALAELATAYAADHFRGRELDSGMHRTIRQPPFVGTRVLLWEAAGTGVAAGRFRVYADDESAWLTMNARFTAGAWSRDTNATPGVALRLGRDTIELLQEAAALGPFAAWSRAWRLPMSDGTSNSGFEVAGAVREVGRCGVKTFNPLTQASLLATGAAVTFRSRFPATPSSVTLAARSVAPAGFFASAEDITRDGFVLGASGTVPAGSVANWYGNYTAIV
jgi:hypothetical protein